MQVLESVDMGPRLNVEEISTRFPPTKMEIGVSKLQGTMTKKSIEVRGLIGGNPSSRTCVDAITILGCRLGTEFEKRIIERLDAFGIANDHSSASVKNRVSRSNHRHRVVCDSDLIEGCLPEALSIRIQHTIYTY